MHVNRKHLNLSHWLNLDKQSQREATSRFSLKAQLILAIVQGLGQYRLGCGSNRVKAPHHLRLLGLNLQANVPSQGLCVQYHNNDIHESSNAYRIGNGIVVWPCWRANPHILSFGLNV